MPTIGVGPFRCFLALIACYIVVLSSIRETSILSSQYVMREPDSTRPDNLRRRQLQLQQLPQVLQQQQQQQNREFAVPIRRQSGTKRRLAILLPYLGLDIPPYLSLFCLGAAGASSVADFIVPHNGILSEWPGRHDCPDNVIFIDLQTTDQMVELMVSRMLSQKPEELWAIPKKRLVALVSRHLESKPYSMVEYKAALGHIYEQYIPTSKYSHWAYSDFDILFGDLERHISKDEWEDFDITTYGYGDQDRLFVRGQFTMHRNDPDVVNQLWRPCTYMSDIDKRFFDVANGQKYRFESGEGCYSVAILQNTEITVKYAVRAWSDAQNIESIYSQGIILTRSPTSPGRHVLVRTREEYIDVDQEQVRGDESTTHLPPPDWFEFDKVYQDYTMDLHEPISDLIPIRTDEATDDCRLGWIQPEYRDKICVPPSAPVTNQTNLFWIRGKRYLQHFQWRQLQNTPYHETAPYFHFMRLKRNFLQNQFASVLDPSLRSILLAPQGGIPLLGPMNSTTVSEDTNKNSKGNVRGKPPSPLGVEIDQWSECIRQDDCMIRDLLPQASYCFSNLVLPKRKYGVKCSDVVSWQDTRRVEIISEATEWASLSYESDVTLTLTLQIEVTGRRDSLSQWIDLINENLRHWYDAPSVVLIHLSVPGGASQEQAVEALRESFSANPLSRKSLVAVVLSDNGVVVSRKALLNMAIDASPTQWFISGLEIESGLVLSSTARERAYQSVQTVMANKDSSSPRVFFIPQFGLNASSLSTDISPTDLFKARDMNLVNHPWSYDRICKRDINSTATRWEDAPYVEWWGHDFFSSIFSLGYKKDLTKILSELLDDPDRLYDFEESPILLVNNQGPRPGIFTHQMAREVEELGGRRCFNGLRMAQLAGFGYKFSVLEGAFVVSTPTTREVALFATDSSLRGNSKCEGCFLFNGNGPDMTEMRDEIAESEMSRPEKSVFLWKSADSIVNALPPKVH